MVRDEWPAPAAATTAEPRHWVDTTLFWSERGGGVRRYLLAKREWLASQPGWRHTLVAPGARGPGMVDLGGVSLPGSGGYRLPLGRGRLARRLVAQAPDLIEAGDPYHLAWAAIDAGQRLGVPVTAFCHSHLPAFVERVAGGQGRLARWARRRAESYVRRLYAGFDLVLAPSRSMTQALLSLGIAAQRQSLGVDTSLFHPRARDPQWRRVLGLPEDARLLLYAGRFAPEKNLPLLVQAVQRLGPRYRLLALGSGPMPPQGAQVIRLPHQSDSAGVARVMASVDAFVHAGDQETFGLAALEAMACGTPVVLRASGGLSELAEGGAAVGVHSARVADWAEAIAAVFSEDRSALSRAGRLRALDHDWRRVLPAQARRYERLLSRSRLTGDEVTEPAVLWRGSGKEDPA